MTAILTASRVPTYERRASIAIEADERQEDVISAVMASGFTLDWAAVEQETTNARDPLSAIESSILYQLDGPEFVETVNALDVNGRLLAAFIQQQHERAAGLALEPVITFAEPDVFTPARAVAYWQNKIGLSDRQAAQLLADLGRGDSPLFGMRNRVAKTVMERITTLFEEAVAQGIAPRDFARQLREIPTPAGWSGGLEDVTNAVIETEYRTNLTEVYSEAAHEQVLARAATFPFLQFMSIRDSRVTWWLCGTLGTCVNGRGYIAATNDEFWFTFRPPLHYRCRSVISPISYLEARRMGILARDGRTKIALVGANPDRPYGDPPEFATHEKTGERRRVAPQDGFGGGGEVRIEEALQPDAQPSVAPLAKGGPTVPPTDAYESSRDLARRYPQMTVPDLPPLAVARALFDVIERIAGAGLAPIGAVRAAMSTLLPGQAFDRAVMALFYNGNVQLHSAPTPSLLTPSEKAAAIPHEPDLAFLAGLVKDERARGYYTAIGILKRV
jgi:hypothetical protein